MTSDHRILRVAARGDGVTADGRHAAFAAPGDLLADDGTLTHGPHHQQPPCRHFPACGGCQLQHLDDAAYAAFVTDRVASALDGQDLTATLRPPLVSPPNTRRRATLHAEGKGGRVTLGFTAEKSHAIVDMRECHILAPDLFAVVAPLRTLLQKLGFKRRGDVHLTVSDQGPDVMVTNLTADGLAAAEKITDFCERHAIARFTLGGIPVPLPPAAFLQATQEGEDALVAAMREATKGAGTIADLFAGLGTFTLALPARVYAAEGARDALFALRAAAGSRQMPVFTEHRDLYRRPLTVAELDRFDAIVIDPPRAGARDQTEALAACQAKVIGYVSCNPSSFARDAKLLIEGGWRIDWVQPVGQFRWSTHVELAARFVR